MMYGQGANSLMQRAAQPGYLMAAVAAAAGAGAGGGSSGGISNGNNGSAGMLATMQQQQQQQQQAKQLQAMLAMASFFPVRAGAARGDGPSLSLELAPYLRVTSPCLSLGMPCLQSTTTPPVVSH